jgi:hypothetical protein
LTRWGGPGPPAVDRDREKLLKTLAPYLEATRDLLRRRLFFSRKAAAFRPHPEHQHPVPPPRLEQRVRTTKDRGAVIEHFENETVQMSVASDIALLGFYE